MAVAELVVNLVAGTAQFTRNLSSAARDIDKFGRKMKSIGGELSKISAPLAAVGGLSVRSFAQFDQAMTESLAIMSNVSDTMKNDMRQAAIDLSKETKFRADEIAEAYYFLASAGMDAEQSLKALPAVASFAQAGAFDLATATDLLTDAQTALGLSSKDAEENQRNLIRVSDVLVGANTKANASVQQFSEALTEKAGGALKTVGKDLEEGVAALAVFADAGLKGSAAGVALNTVLVQLPNLANKNADAFKRLKIEVFDSNGKMRNLADIVRDYEKATENANDAEKSRIDTMLGFNRNTQSSMRLLAGQSERLREVEKGLRDVGGLTEKVSKEQMKSFSAQMKVLTNNLNAAGIVIGTILGPYLIKLSEYLIDAINWFDSLSDTTKTWIVVVGGIVAALGPVIYAIGSLTTTFAALIPVVKTVAGLFLATGPWGLAIGAAAAIIYVFGDDINQALGDAFKDIQEFVRKSTRALVDSENSFVANLGRGLRAISLYVQTGDMELATTSAALQEHAEKTGQAVDVVAEAYWRAQGVVEETQGEIREEVGETQTKTAQALSDSKIDFENYGNDVALTSGEVASALGSMADEGEKKLDRLTKAAKISSRDITQSFGQMTSTTGSMLNNLFQSFGGGSAFGGGGSSIGGILSSVVGSLGGSSGGSITNLLDSFLNDQFGVFAGAGMSGADAHAAGIAGPMLEGGGFGGDAALANVGYANAAIQAATAIFSGGGSEQMGQGIGTALGTAIGTYIMPGIGSAIGGQLGSVVGEAVGGLFGGGPTHPETLARIAFRDALNGIVDGSNIRLVDEEGVLQEFQGISFDASDMFNSEWHTAFEDVAGSANTAFDVAGQALTDFFGITEDIGGQMGYVLATHLNGNLENLGRLLNGMDIPLERMEEQFLKMMESGQISVREYVIALRDLRGGYEAAGQAAVDVDVAINELLQTSGDSMQSVRAIANLAKAAKEEGIESIDALRNRLIATGRLTEEQVEVLMNGLAAHGIGSVEQFADASTETLASILAFMTSVALDGGEVFFEMFEDIAAGFDGLQRDAREAARDANRELSNISAPEIDMNITPSALGNVFSSGRVQAFAKGGVVTKPAMFDIGSIAEKGPEAIMPLERGSDGELGVKVVGGSGGGVNLVFNGEVIEAAFAERVKDIFRNEMDKANALPGRSF